jgi:alpha-D-xyloside xylohydrolase
VRKGLQLVTQSRMVYLPAGADWYNYWTRQRHPGGQAIRAAAPIDTLPLFVRAGSIIPLGTPIQSTDQVQTTANVQVYAGRDADFTLYQDDGRTYAYEKGHYKLTHLHWDDASRKLTQTGERAWTYPDAQVVEVIGF